MQQSVQVRAATTGDLAWESAVCPIPPLLKQHVRSLTGYSERCAASVRRRELPGPQIVVILEFGPPLRVFESGSETRGDRFRGGFVAGLGDTFSLTEHAGYQAGIQLNLTPLGARTLFGIPLQELSNRVLSLPDIWPEQRDLAERLAGIASWHERFRGLIALLLERCWANASSSPAYWAAHQIEVSQGRIDVASIANELGISHKHLITLFHDRIGLPPKLYAGLIRFDRLMARIRSQPGASFSRLALDLGFTDQAHLNREVKRFAGVTPTQLHSLFDVPFSY
jgi:AraC-like DNA-binding protein